MSLSTLAVGPRVAFLMKVWPSFALSQTASLPLPLHYPYPFTTPPPSLLLPLHSPSPFTPSPFTTPPLSLTVPLSLPLPQPFLSVPFSISLVYHKT